MLCYIVSWIEYQMCFISINCIFTRIFSSFVWFYSNYVLDRKKISVAVLTSNQNQEIRWKRNKCWRISSQKPMCRLISNSRRSLHQGIKICDIFSLHLESLVWTTRGVESARHASCIQNCDFLSRKFTEKMWRCT